MWKCERHIPTSKMYPAIIAKCVACGFPRPDEAYRPPMNPEEPKPVVRVVPPPPPVVEPEPPVVTWVDGPEPELDEEPGIEETRVPDPIQRGIELLDKVIQDEDIKPIETAPVASKRPKDIPVTEKTFSEDMSLGQAQRDLDEMIIADLFAAAGKIKKSRVNAPTPTALEPVTKRPKDVPNIQKSKAHLCPGPKCRKVSRRNSPYCSKICSDRCLRLRKKATEKPLTDEEIKNLNRIVSVLEVWGGHKG
jgi:hypothetical protein